MKGLVIRSTGSWYEVHTEQGVVSCTLPGRFRKQAAVATNPVVIGDVVTVDSGEEDGTGQIVEIAPRQNKLSRRAAGRRVGVEHVIMANIDTAWIVQSVQKPKFNGGLVDRFLVMASVYDIPAGIIINKSDLIDERSADAMAFWSGLYEGLGYPVVFTSATTHDGTGVLKSELAAGMHVLVGASGVGKSSLVNVLIPGAGQRTSHVSERTRKGRHTTTFAELIRIPGGGWLADTPGLREFGLVGLSPQELGHHFPEIARTLPECRFPNCTHDHEPGCRVKELVQEFLVGSGGAEPSSGGPDAELVISAERYESYLSMLAAIRLGDADTGR